MTFNFTTPVGRLVYGSVWEGNDKDFKTGQPRLIKTGPNAGKPRIDWAFGVAFPKVLANGQPNNEFYDFYRNVIEVARGGYPQFFNGQLDNFTGKPGCTHPRMTFKIRDGDGVDADGKQNNQKEGWAGHYIVSFSGSFAPRVFDINVGLAPEQQLQDKTRVLPGDYVSVAGTCEPNIGSDVPGVYMNGNLVAFVATGPRIVSGPKAAEAFAGLSMANLPAGCVPGATPASVAPNVPAVPAVGVGSAPAVAGTVPSPMVSVPPVAAVPASVVPNVGFTANAGTVAPPPAASPAIAPPPPPVAAGPQLTPAGIAAGGSYAAFQASGWTDDQMRAAGYLA